MTATEATEAVEDSTPNAEAAKYRTRLREAEKALQEVTAQRDTLARSVVESHLPAHVTPKLFWQLHSDMSDLIGDDGAVNLDAVTTSVQTLAQEYGLTPRPTAPVVQDVGRQPEAPKNTMWQEVVQGRSEVNEL